MSNRSLLFAFGCLSVAFAAPALADVKDGVDAWGRGDYQAAIAQWQAPAAAGDPDALFNLGQAYRLGRGVPIDLDAAQQYYAKAAAKGHLQAADIYGLMLFQRGQREAALPYIQDAARRGDPRSEYLLGIAFFNGDLVSKDWIRAYALLTLANGQGLPQATPAIAQMDKYIPIDQRQKAASLAVQLQHEADQARAQELASADLALSGDEPVPAAARPAAKQVAALPDIGSRVPQPIASVPVPASAAPSAAPALSEAQDALRQASLATGTENPAEAGADYARPAVPAPRTPAPKPPEPKQAEPTHVAVAASAPTPVVSAPSAKAPKPAPASKPAPAAKASASGEWKIQLGAFGVKGNAEKLWAKLSVRPELAGKKRLLVPAGGLTKLLAGGFATQADAAEACSRLKQAGQTCLVTK